MLSACRGHQMSASADLAGKAQDGAGTRYPLCPPPSAWTVPQLDVHYRLIGAHVVWDKGVERNMRQHEQTGEVHHGRWDRAGASLPAGEAHRVHAQPVGKQLLVQVQIVANIPQFCTGRVWG